MAELPLNIALRDASPARLRLLETGDVEMLTTFFAEFSEQDRAFFHPHPFDRETARQRCTDGNSPEQHTMVLELVSPAPRIAGYGFLWRFQSDVPLLGLGIAEPHQGLGIGRTIATWLVEHAGSLAKDGIDLTVYKTNHRAVALYASLGFEPCGETYDQLQWRMHRKLQVR